MLLKTVKMMISLRYKTLVCIDDAIFIDVLLEAKNLYKN